MLTASELSAPKLQPPGMGLPRVELFFARIFVWYKLRTTSQEKATQTFLDEARQILAVADSIDPAAASKRVLIDRLRGLEDSSRYWSVYMTLEHLRIVNRFTIDLIKSLTKGMRPQLVASTAAVKPREDADQSVVPAFRSLCEEFEKTFPKDCTLQSPVTFTHPWFGELNARQWHFFAGFHMSLHRKQITKIVGEVTRANGGRKVRTHPF